jgi:hypothetical protein
MASSSPPEDAVVAVAVKWLKKQFTVSVNKVCSVSLWQRNTKL